MSINKINIGNNNTGIPPIGTAGTEQNIQSSVNQATQGVSDSQELLNNQNAQLATTEKPLDSLKASHREAYAGIDTDVYGEKFNQQIIDWKNLAQNYKVT